MILLKIKPSRAFFIVLLHELRGLGIISPSPLKIALVDRQLRKEQIKSENR